MQSQCDVRHSLQSFTVVASMQLCFDLAHPGCRPTLLATSTSGSVAPGYSLVEFMSLFIKRDRSPNSGGYFHLCTPYSICTDAWSLRHSGPLTRCPSLPSHIEISTKEMIKIGCRHIGITLVVDRPAHSHPRISITRPCASVPVRLSLGDTVGNSGRICITHT
jgi:hypothetical protein